MKRPNINARLLASANMAVLLKIGMAVTYTADSGRAYSTKTRSNPWQLGHGQWVILVEGISGAVDCARVRAA